MKISEDTEKVIAYLDEVSEHSLRKKNDLATILEIGATFQLAESMNFIIFRGKAVWNLSRKLWKVSPDDEGSRLLQKEMVRAVEEIKDTMQEMLSYADDDDIKRFNDIYMPATRGALKNIVDLSHDLARLKDLQVDSQRARKAQEDLDNKNKNEGNDDN